MANFQYLNAKESPNWLNMSVINLGPWVLYSKKCTKLHYKPMAFSFVIRSPWCSSSIPGGAQRALEIGYILSLNWRSHQQQDRVTVFSNWTDSVLLQSWGIACGCSKVEIFHKKWCHRLLWGSNTRLLSTVRSLVSNLLHDVVYQRQGGWRVPPWVALAGR